MIRRVWSELASFKELAFSSGLNVLLADRSQASSDRDTRNGAGKSSLVEIVHFVLGGNVEASSIFRRPALSPYEFGLELDLGDRTVVVGRRGSAPSRIRLFGNGTQWPVEAETHEGYVEISNEDWKTILGLELFGLPTDPEFPHTPSFRGLFPYFARREAAGGFQAPTKHYPQQSAGEYQTAISFLLGIDWSIAARLESIRDLERSIRQRRSDLATRYDAGELRTRLSVAEARLVRTSAAIDEFRVVEEYAEYEAELAQVTERLAALANANTIDRRVVARVEEATEEEVLPDDPEQLLAVYEDAGATLAEGAIRRYEEVSAFHQSVISNRQSYLASERQAALDRIADREQAMRGADTRRAELLQLLGSGGALDQLSALQMEQATLRQQVASLRADLELLETVEVERAGSQIERNQLRVRLLQDLHEQEPRLRSAILSFEEASAALYEEGGSFEVTDSLNGPEFRVSIHGGTSRGIRNMQIFCFDMMLMAMCAAQGIGPRFLVHDSHLFDGVDERQVGRALAFGARRAEELGWQYVVTLNSDVEPEYPAGFSLDDYTLPIRLTDASETGGLFGIRFD